MLNAGRRIVEEIGFTLIQEASAFDRGKGDDGGAGDRGDQSARALAVAVTEVDVSLLFHIRDILLHQVGQLAADRVAFDVFKVIAVCAVSDCVAGKPDDRLFRVVLAGLPEVVALLLVSIVAVDAQLYDLTSA